MRILDRISLTRLVNLPLLLAVAICGAVQAHAQGARGLSPSPAGAEVSFKDLADGATVSPQLKLNFDLRNMSAAPAGSDQPNSGHYHLLIDTELPPLNQPIPNSPNQLHFDAGQTEADITLKPGAHTLQLLM
jgi:hypothetical protein